MQSRNLPLIRSDASVDEMVLVRTAGMPVSVLHSFHEETVDRLLDRLSRVTTEFHDLTRSVEDALYTEIGTLPDGDRALAVALRRAVHREAPDEKLFRAVSDILQPETGQKLTAWLDLRKRIVGLRHELQTELEDAEGKEIEHVRQQCKTPAFMRGLNATNPSLGAMAARWANRETTVLQRKRVGRLALMLARASAKTSPFSSWMTASVSRWGEHGSTVEPPSIVAELDGAAAEAVSNAVRSKLAVDRHQELIVNTSLVRTKDGYLYVRAGGQSEQAVRVRSHPAIAAVLTALTAGDTTATLAERLGESNEPMIDKCIDVGLLERVAPVPDLNPEPWIEWARLANECGEADLSALLDTLQHALKTADHESATTAVKAITERLGKDAPAVSVHEVSVADQPGRPTPDLPPAEAISELDCARRLLALFDLKLPAKVAAGEYLVGEFGTNHDVSLTEALDSIMRGALERGTELGRILGPSAPPWGPDLTECSSDLLRTMGAARHELVEEVLGRAAAGPLDVEDVLKAVDAFPVRHPNLSATVYVQDVHAPDVHRVVNVVHGGHGRGRGRHAAQMGIQAAQMVPYPNDTVVELSGMLGSTLNVRAATTRRELQYPGATSGRPPEQRLPFNAVRVVPGVGGVPELRDPDGRIVRPVHLGMAADLALPPFARLLEQVFGSAFLSHPSVPAFTPNRPGSGMGIEASTPRVVLGRTAVQRARWFVRREQLPASGRGREAVESWKRWLAQRGLSTRFYLRAWSPADHAGQTKARKPVYVDVTSPLLLGEAQRMLKEARFAIVEECLPDPLHAVGHVTEYAVEIGERR